MDILYTEIEIQKRVQELAEEISEDYEGEEVIVVGILKGAFIFTADLVRHLTCKNIIDFMDVSSYGSGTISSGKITLDKDLTCDPKGRHVILVEDLIDTGNTLQWIKEYLQSKDTKSVKICCLLDKDVKRKNYIDVDYVGFKCPNEFVVGYGMDYDGAYRNCPHVGILHPEVYQNK